MKKKIEEYNIENCGIENPDYFQGKDTSFSLWEYVYVGIGVTLFDAIEDALEMCAEAWDITTIEKGLTLIPETEPAEEGMYYHVAIYVR